MILQRRNCGLQLLVGNDTCIAEQLSKHSPKTCNFEMAIMTFQATIIVKEILLEP